MRKRLTPLLIVVVGIIIFILLRVTRNPSPSATRSAPGGLPPKPSALMPSSRA